MRIVFLIQRIGTIFIQLICFAHIYHVRCLAYHHVIVAVEITDVAKIGFLLQLPRLSGMFVDVLEISLLIVAAQACMW